MPVIQNTTTTAQFSQLQVREIDFIERFNRNWDALREILGIMRPIPKEPGTKLVSSVAEVTLADGAVPEGDEVPLSQASVKPVTYGETTGGEPQLWRVLQGHTSQDDWRPGVAVSLYQAVPKLGTAQHEEG